MRKRRTYYQQIAAAVNFEKKLNAILIKVTREHGKANFTFKHNKTGKMWRTTLSKLENYNHDNLNKPSKKEINTYWAPKEWKKAAKVSPHFDSFKVYIIKCTLGNESFYKIGRTFNTVEKRFANNDFPYNYKVERIYVGSAEYVCKLEKTLHDMNKANLYVPKRKFSGSSECFTKVTTHDNRMFFNGLHTFW